MIVLLKTTRIWGWGAGGQSYNIFYTLGRCKIKCLNCRFNTYDEFNLINMLGCSVLTLRHTKVLLAHFFHASGHVCKFVLRCKIFIGLAPDARMFL